VLSRKERAIALALARAAMPATGSLPGADERSIDRFERLLGNLGPTVARAAKAGLWAAEAWPVTRLGLPLSLLSTEQAERVVGRWNESGSRHERWLLRGILTPLKSAHFDDDRVAAHVHCRREVDAPKVAEVAPYMQRVTDGRHVETDLDLTCEVVVIGTGAGGAAIAYELAKRGRAVLMLEGGHYHSRTEFKGRSQDAYARMYLSLGGTVAIGNVAAPILAGRGVGGSTTINSGTCYRAPAHTLSRWGERYGLTMHTPEGLAPYYDRVESMLGVAEAKRSLLGGSDRVVGRGANLMGLSHKPLRRNAPDCDGQGVCCFGCPTGAKRSTDVSYVPEALKRGAEMVTGASVERIHVHGGRARGVTARLASGRTLNVRAEAVVVAGGALSTPLLLQKNGLMQASGFLGRNLSIHPATKVMALFDEEIDMSRGIPQASTIEDYAHEGLMFEGASTPFDVTAVAIPWVGSRFMDVMSRYPQVATFGLMIQDKSRGSVRAGPGGTPLIFYDLNAEDLAKMQRGLGILSEVFLRAGARRVMPMVNGCEEIVDESGLARLRGMKLRGGDFEVSAYHPLGTCRMGTDPRRSCVGPDGEAHDVMGLFVADGSVIPSSLGVNPQLTIMALALRTAEALDARLDHMSPPSSGTFGSTYPLSHDLPANDAQLEAAGIAGASSAPQTARHRGPSRNLAFEETMSGTFRLTPEPGTGPRSGAVESAGERPMLFSLHARSRSLVDFARTRTVQIVGHLTAEGLGVHCPLEGTLEMDVLLKRRLRYDFTFTAQGGERLRYLGQKDVKLLHLGRSMTWLPGKILDQNGKEIATSEVTFDLGRDLIRFLRSFRITAA
jgi:choline dehydrogenase-like flavoprotein